MNKKANAFICLALAWAGVAPSAFAYNVCHVYQGDEYPPPRSVDSVVFRVVAIDEQNIRTIGTAFYVGTFRNQAMFLTAEHVIEDAVLPEIKAWGIAACGADTADLAIYPANVLFRPEDKEASDISAISIKVVEGSSFFESLSSVAPLKISAELENKHFDSKLGWWAGYPESRLETEAPARERESWRALPIHSRSSLVVPSAKMTPGRGVSGGPVFIKRNNEIAIIGVLATTPLAQDLTIDEIIDIYPNLTEQMAKDLQRAGITASPLYPSHPVVVRTVETSACQVNIIKSIENNDVDDLKEHTKNCFGGQQPIIVAYRIIDWLYNKANSEDRAFAYFKGKTYIDKYIEMTGDSRLEELLLALWGNVASSDGGGGSTRLNWIESARSMYDAYVDGGRADAALLERAIKIIESGSYVAINRFDLISDGAKKSIYSGLSDAYFWRQELKREFGSDQGGGFSRNELADLICAVSLSPDRSLAWGYVADYFRERGDRGKAASAYLLKASLSQQNSSHERVARKRCSELSESESFCSKGSEVNSMRLADEISRNLTIELKIPESLNNEERCVAAVAPLREAMNTDAVAALPPPPIPNEKLL